MAKGIIYLMSTCVDGLVKIGKTGLDNFESRMSHLERDGYHRISVLKREFAIEVEDYDEKEKLLHEIFSKSRVGDSELFSVDINLVEQLMSSLEGKVIYPKNVEKEQVFENATEAVESSLIHDGEYYLETKVRHANMVCKAVLSVKDGHLMLLKGSVIAPVKELTVASWLAARNALKLENGVLQEDVSCPSPSMAASIVTGHSMNGWTSWKDSNGNPIDQFRK